MGWLPYIINNPESTTHVSTDLFDLGSSSDEMFDTNTEEAEAVDAYKFKDSLVYLVSLKNKKLCFTLSIILSVSLWSVIC